MSATVVSSAQPYVQGSPKLASRISLSAVLAGSVVAIAAGLMFNLLGVGVGLSTVNAVAQDSPDAATAALVSSLWLMAATALSLATGGYVAARLSGNTDSTDSALHGLAVWGIGFIISALLVANAATGAMSGVVQGASTVMGGAAQGAGAAVSVVAGQVDPRTTLEQAQRVLTGAEDPQTMTTEARSAEIAAILARRAVAGNDGAGDRARLEQLVAAEARITPEQARQRIDAYEAQARRAAAEVEARARQAADAAAKASAITAFWAFATLLLGGAAAALGGMFGAREMVRRRAAVVLRD